MWLPLHLQEAGIGQKEAHSFSLDPLECWFHASEKPEPHEEATLGISSWQPQLA